MRRDIPLSTAPTLVVSPASTPLGHAPVEQLGEAIAELASRIHAATYDLLIMLRAFDAQLGWNNGFLSCAHWLHWRTGIDLGAAREKVRVAHALAALPRISGALERGVISYAKARALTRVATAENEAKLLDIALAGTASHVERVVRAWRRCDRVAAARQEEQRYLHRELATYVDDDGMVVIRGRLTPEVGAVLRRALDAAAEQLRAESQDAARPTSLVEESTAGQRRADALARLAEAALTGGLDPGAAGDRYQVVVHVDQVDAHASVDIGDHCVDVSAETSRRLACDASVVVMHHDATGAVLDVGRKTRTVPPAIRRALAVRDAHCQFPGCTARRCDAHHIEHWADGGGTALDNLVLLCRRHHRFVHEGGWLVHRHDGGVVEFTNHRGGRVAPAPPPPTWAAVSTTDDGDPLGVTWDRLRASGITARHRTAAVWDGTPFRLNDVIDVLRGREPLASEGSRTSSTPSVNSSTTCPTPLRERVSAPTSSRRHSVGAAWVKCGGRATRG